MTEFESKLRNHGYGSAMSSNLKRVDRHPGRTIARKLAAHEKKVKEERARQRAESNPAPPRVAKPIDRNPGRTRARKLNALRQQQLGEWWKEAWAARVVIPQEQPSWQVMESSGTGFEEAVEVWAGCPDSDDRPYGDVVNATEADRVPLGELVEEMCSSGFQTLPCSDLGEP